MKGSLIAGNIPGRTQTLARQRDRGEAEHSSSCLGVGMLSAIICSMRTSTLLLLSSALALSIAASANAATYYVATTGNGSNPGTFSQPVQTITQGVAKLTAAGDILYVRGGTYNEQVTIWNKAGTSGSQYWISPYGSETVVIDGTGKSGNGVVVIDESAYVNFDSFEVKNGANAGILVWNSNHVSVQWNDVHDDQTSGISAGCDTVGTTHDITFDGNNVHHNVLSNSARTATSGWSQALSSFMSNHVTFTNNYVTENYGEGIDFIVGDYATIANNHVWDNYSADIYLDNAQYATVDSNFVASGYGANPTNYYRDGYPAGAIVIANETYTGMQNPATDLTITNNIILWCHAGIHYGNWQYGGGLHHTLIANNTIYQSGYASLWIENGANNTNIHDTTTIDNNIFLQGSGIAYADAPSTGITYRTNCWYGGTSGTSKSGVGDVTTSPLLVNAGGGNDTDYKLSSTSPCKTAGTTETAVAKDYWGTTRTASYSIGAHEY